MLSCYSKARTRDHSKGITVLTNLIAPFFSLRGVSNSFIDHLRFIKLKKFFIILSNEILQEIINVLQLRLKQVTVEAHLGRISPHIRHNCVLGTHFLANLQSLILQIFHLYNLCGLQYKSVSNHYFIPQEQNIVIQLSLVMSLLCLGQISLDKISLKEVLECSVSHKKCNLSRKSSQLLNADLSCLNGCIA